MSTDIERLKREAKAGDLDAARELYRLAERLQNGGLLLVARRALNRCCVVLEYDHAHRTQSTSRTNMPTLRLGWQWAHRQLRGSASRDTGASKATLIDRHTGAVVCEVTREQVTPAGDWLAQRDHMRRQHGVILTRGQALAMARGETVEVVNVRLRQRGSHLAAILPRATVALASSGLRVSFPQVAEERESLAEIWGARR